ncbi:LytR/AlgR family response regulator transcription factor [Cyclobacterium jeungdonense]|uniref:LytTR family DNA-binding domain-containing protein n=1 Tax=Cyclobacterium jeungdonense TaxID=708087 RepID=A0ABT8C4F5_9BACT|nr:LytTR family DNA-binding domain-containing protein [Cyclobacterium jeungdonense]MDN3686673.1 LytTR family DNA-binding domain-containing protein [Cyclobacterium jeungdonense]
MIRCVIIDDEPLARELLADYLAEFTDFEVVGAFQDGFEGFKGIAETKPELLFLDIEMPKINGFELLELLDEPPKVIFTTAYDTYAIQAFDQQAIDYLLKPFSKERLKQALEKVSREVQDPSGFPSRLRAVSEGLQVRDYLQRVVVKTGTKIHILPVGTITYFSADGDYVKIVAEGKSYLKLGTMGYFEKVLNPEEFARIHRSHMVNVSMISKIEPFQKENFLVYLKEGTQLPVSKTGMGKLRKTLRI